MPKYLKIVDLKRPGKTYEYPTDVVLPPGNIIEIGKMTPKDFDKIQEVRGGSPSIPTILIYKAKGTEYVSAIKLDDEHVSKHHGTLERNGTGEIFYADHSRNGTKKGAELVHNKLVPFLPGDELCFGVPGQYDAFMIALIEK